MAKVDDIRYIVFDTESVVDGALLSRVLYSGEGLDPQAAIGRYREEQGASRPGENVFIPVTFHVPVAVAAAKVGADLRIRDVVCLDAPRFDPRHMVSLFWRGVEAYSKAALVDFNGRGFDLPLMTLSAFRFGVSCQTYFGDGDRFGFRYRFTSKHIDLMEWLTEYGAYRMKGGLDLLAKMLGKPGKMDTKGSQVDELYAQGELQRISDYCLHDVLDTYFVFLRTRVMGGEISIDQEQEIVADTKNWLARTSETIPALEKYVECFGSWTGVPFE